VGLEVKITTTAGFAVQSAAARRRALVRAGRAVILPLARARAPRDTGLMIENSHADLVVDERGEAVSVTFDEDYSVFEELGEHYHHPNGGGPHFLEGALLDGHAAALEVVAAEIRAALGGGR